MRIEHIRALRGPNTHHTKPVLVVRLDLESLTQVESYEVDGFVERLLRLLPGLQDHHCSRGERGGFVERLHEGTYFGHITEHVALELSELAGIGVTYGKARYAGREGLYDVVVRYRSEEGMRFLVRTAVDLVETLVAGHDFALESAIEEAKRIVRRGELGPSTLAIVSAAERRDIPWERLGEGSLIRFGYGIGQRYIRASVTGGTGLIAADIAQYKDLTKQRLEEAFVPTPRGRVVRSAQAALEALDALGGPVVVKPLDGNHGRAVAVGVSSPEEVQAAFAAASEVSRLVLVEEQLSGRDYRVLVVGGRVVAASERRPCHVVGDGALTVAELIEGLNADPRRGEGHERPLTRVTVDPALEVELARSGLKLSSVPALGECVVLCRSANLSRGGSAHDVTDALHPEVKAACERAARAVGLDVCGVDLVAEDISRPLVPGQGGVVEVNAAPGLRMHLYPSEGKPRPVGEAIVSMLYPEGTTARIPIVSVTGTNGKTTVTRLIGHLLREAGETVGMTTTGGVWIGEHCALRGDTTGPGSARAVLTDSSVTAAVLETARGGIARRGLGYDWADIGVITNVRADHFGQDGIETIDDLIHVKALVAERVRPGGTLIVNADDEGALRLLERPTVRADEKRLVYFSMSPDNPVVRRHLARGGTVFYARGGWIVEANAGGETQLARVAEVPLTFGGRADFQVANCLAAAAAARAYGLARSAVGSALVRFDTTADNAGRANLYRLGRGYLMIDYGHNPDAFEAVGEFLRKLSPGHPTIGVVNVPGDRSDALIRESGRAIARAFSELILSEDKDLRERAPGEVLGLLQEGVAEEARSLRVEVVPDECEALRAVLDRVRAGAVAVTFYEHLEPLLDILREAGAEQVDRIPPLERRTRLPSAHEGDGLPSPESTEFSLDVVKGLRRHMNALGRVPPPG